jgi:NADH:ubiquinone oxidoreductase subunit
MGILNSVLRAITWWNGQTYGTQLFTRRHGTKVGDDADGNIYYRNEDDSRRWVIFSGEIEATKIPPDWHGWLHRLYDEPPSESPLPHKAWEKEPQENLSGTLTLGYRAPGALTQKAPKPRQDYEAWAPE